MNDLSEVFLESMKIVAESTIANLAYDKTIVCTITNTDLAENGVYTVSDSSSSFKAFSSDTSYEVDDSVYVTVPQGDYSQQKIIIGKYTSADDTNYNYYPSMKNFIDVTGNLCPNTLSATILANGNTLEKKVFTHTFQEPIHYSTLGLETTVISQLLPFNIATGDFGLKIKLIASDDSGVIEGISPKRDYYCLFNSSQMYGNPYNFDAGSTQEKIFNISNLNKIYGLEVYIYQQNNFINKDRERLEYGESDYLFDNLTFKDIFLAFGYDAMEFDSDTVVLYSPNNSTFSSKFTKQQNEKQIKMTWVHYLSDQEQEESETNKTIQTFKNMSELNGRNIIIHWYKYRLSNDISDDLAGAFWEEQIDALNAFTYTLNPNTTLASEKIKIIIEDIDDSSSDLEDGYDKTLYESEILEFTNTEEVSNLATVDLIQALTIECDTAEYKGNFLCYNEANEIKDLKDASKYRYLVAHYNSLISGEDELDTASSITWKIPLINTMIEEPKEGNGCEYDLSENGLSTYIEDGYRVITRAASDPQSNIGSILNNAAEQKFRIKRQFAANATNNTVYCSIVKNNITYEASYTMFFSSAGVQGTGYSVQLLFDNNVNAVTPLNEKEPFHIRVEVLDPEALPVTDITSITYYWKNSDSNNSYIFCDANGAPLTGSNNRYTTTGRNIYFMKKTGCSVYHHILVVEIKKATAGSSLGALTKAAPIPYSQNTYSSYSWNSYSGPSAVVYNNQGTSPSYNSKHIQLYSNVAAVTIPNASWSVVYQNNNDQAYHVKILTQKVNDITQWSLGVPSLYVNNLSTATLVYSIDSTILWAQPLIISQEIYGSDLLNSWNGNLTIDEKNDIILAAMMGAGIKNSDNTFSGVLMGDCGKSKDTGKIGMFGYHHGSQSFGFDVDGTAFIGKAGLGRLSFNGNTGVIQSGAYETTNGASGMAIDFVNGTINIKNNSAQILLDSKAKTNNPYLKIVSNNNKILMSVDNNSYFLQSDNYITNTSGSKWNLVTGKLELNSTDADNKSKIIINPNASGASAHFAIVDANNKNLIYIAPSSQYMQSANYESGKTGIKFDLTNGKLELNSNTGNSKIIINPNATGTTAHFQIQSGDKNLIYIAPTTQYIQSSNFVAGSSGIKFDLTKGQLELNSADVNNKTTVKIDPRDGQPLFSITVNGGEIFRAASNAYFLRSSNFSTSNGNILQGTSFDLATGSIRGASLLFLGRVSSGDYEGSYIAIETKENEDAEDIDGYDRGVFSFRVVKRTSDFHKALINCGPESFRLLSPNYIPATSTNNNPAIGKDKDGDPYYAGRGTSFFLHEGTLAMRANNTSFTDNEITYHVGAKSIALNVQNETWGMGIYRVRTSRNDSNGHLIIGGVRFGWNGTIQVNEYYSMIPLPIDNKTIKINGETITYSYVDLGDSQNQGVILGTARTYQRRYDPRYLALGGSNDSFKFATSKYN